MWQPFWIVYTETRGVFVGNIYARIYTKDYKFGDNNAKNMISISNRLIHSTRKSCR